MNSIKNKQREYLQCGICLDTQGTSAKYTKEALRNHVRTVHKAKKLGEKEK